MGVVIVRVMMGVIQFLCDVLCDNEKAERIL